MAQGIITRLTSERLGVIITDSPGYKNSGSNFFELLRVQSADYGFSHQSSQIKQIGSDVLVTRNAKNPVMRSPDVNLQVTYLFNTYENEENIGFYIGNDASVLKNFIDSTNTNDINLLVIASNKDANEDMIFLGTGEFEGFNVIGFGNAFLTNYNYSAAVGSLPTCSLSYEAGNISFDIYSDDSKPTLPSLKLGVEDYPNHNSRSSELISLNGNTFKSDNVEILTIKPGDIKVHINKIDGQKGGADIVTFPFVQSVDIDLPIPRQPIYGMGSNFAFDRKIKAPAVGTLSMQLVLNKFEQDAATMLFSDPALYQIKLEHVDLNGNSIFIEIESAQLEAQNFSNSIQGNSSADIQLSYFVSSSTGLKIYPEYPA